MLDDHLLRDLLADELGNELRNLLDEFEPATTNYYLYRLSRSVVSAAGGTLTGSWNEEQRRELGARLLDVPDEIEIVPMRILAYTMAEIVSVHRVSALGAEAVAAANYLGAPLCVWKGDDGPEIRAAIATHNASYRAIGH